ncbi:MAG TPA: sulfotransferase family 2 domain-containing protein, partial [Cyclobacteriaceae bacterium]|nr:sulfotransferase family 2 domain-containing protein [Cyclobacteriaceae bacterium]
MKQYLQLAVQLLKHGTLRSAKQDFNTNRANSLETLPEFIPAGKSVSRRASVPNLVGQAAFIRSSFRKQGGHLSAEGMAYIRIPKSANTSVSYAMLVKKYPALKEKKPNETQINFLADVNLLPMKETAGEHFFTVVRNPFARLVSVYRDFFETNHAEFIYAD